MNLLESFLIPKQRPIPLAKKREKIRNHKQINILTTGRSDNDHFKDPLSTSMLWVDKQYHNAILDCQLKTNSFKLLTEEAPCKYHKAYEISCQIWACCDKMLSNIAQKLYGFKNTTSLNRVILNRVIKRRMIKI